MRFLRGPKVMQDDPGDPQDPGDPGEMVEEMVVNWTLAATLKYLST